LVGPLQKKCQTDPPTFKYGCHTNKYCKLDYFGYNFFGGLFGKIKHAKIRQTPKIKTPKLAIVNCNEPTHKHT
jgi:hypothetical protein